MTNEQEYLHLRASIKGLAPHESIAWLTAYIASNPESDEALTLRGMRYWGMSRRSDAMNDYLAAIRINPESRAVQALEAANEILDFFNKDLYNP